MKHDDVAGSLLDALASEGEFVDDGGFTLDSSKAREKLGEYQLADAHEWILLAISAGVAATAGRGPIHVHTGAMASVRFEGLSLTPMELENLFAAVFVSAETQVLRLLGLAGNAALSLGSTELQIESHDAAGTRHVLRIDEDGNQTITHEQLDDHYIGVRVTVRGDERRESDRERELVGSRCRFSSAVIRLDEVLVSAGPSAALEGAARCVDVLLEGERIGRAGRIAGNEDPAKALIINWGVLVETITLENLEPGFCAVVETGLPMDLGHRKVLRNEDWTALITAIVTAHVELSQANAAALSDGWSKRASSRSNSQMPPAAGLSLRDVLVILAMVAAVVGYVLTSR